MNRQYFNIKDFKSNSSVYYSALNTNFTLIEDIILVEQLSFEHNIDFIKYKKIEKEINDFEEWYILNNKEIFNREDLLKSGSEKIYKYLFEKDDFIKVCSTKNIEIIKNKLSIYPLNYINYIMNNNEDVELEKLIRLLMKIYNKDNMNDRNDGAAVSYFVTSVQNVKENALYYLSLYNDIEINKFKFNLHFFCKAIKTEYDSDIKEILTFENEYTEYFNKLTKEEIISNLKNEELIHSNYELLSNYLEDIYIEKEVVEKLMNKNKQIYYYLNKVKNQQEIYEWTKNILSKEEKIAYLINTTKIIKEDTYLDSIEIEKIIKIIEEKYTNTMDEIDLILYCDKIDNLNTSLENKIKILKNTIKRNENKLIKGINYITEKNYIHNNLKNF